MVKFDDVYLACTFKIKMFVVLLHQEKRILFSFDNYSSSKRFSFNAQVQFFFFKCSVSNCFCLRRFFF